MATPLSIYPHVFKWEGGLVFHQNEGQFTNMGIQYSTYTALCEKLLNRKPTMEHFKAMKKAEAEKFIQYYWNLATFKNAIKSQEAANLMFQAYWGSGSVGIKEMQKALNAAFKTRLAIDGIVGPQTVGVINSQPKASAVLYAALENKYKSLAQSPVYAKYLKGWLNRLEELRPFMYAGSIVLLIATFLIFSKL